jgi:hypothetical protein
MGCGKIFLSLFTFTTLILTAFCLTRPTVQPMAIGLQTFENVIYVPAGVWEINQTMVLSNNTLLYGEGMGISVLRLANNSNTDMIRNADATKGNCNITIRDLTFDGNRDNQNGSFRIMNFINIVNLTVLRCEFMGSKYSAIYVFRSGVEAKCENINITACIFRDRKTLDGGDIFIRGYLGLPSAWIRNVIVDRNYGFNNMKFAFMAVEKASITNNVLINSDRGIVFRGVMDSHVKNNTVLDINDDGGICYGGVWLESQVGLWTKNITIEENKIINSLDHGIGSQGSNHTNVTIRRNLIQNTTLPAIYCPSGTNFTCTENVVDKLTDLVLPSGTTIKGNWIESLDFDKNRKIDMADIGPLAREFGKTQNSSDWNPKFDVYPDGKIDLHDIAPAAQNFAMAKPEF